MSQSEKQGGGNKDKPVVGSLGSADFRDDEDTDPTIILPSTARRRSSLPAPMGEDRRGASPSADPKVKESGEESGEARP